MLPESGNADTMTALYIESSEGLVKVRASDLRVKSAVLAAKFDSNV